MRPLLFFALLVVSFSLTAQNRTNVWELGYPFIQGNANCELTFQNGFVDTSSVFRIMNFFDANTSICDTSGKLLFYTNGLCVGNHNLDTLQNSSNFNPGEATDFYEPDGLGTDQSVLILPDPGNSQRYYLFHESGEFFLSDSIFQLQPFHLSYSVIDMGLDSGLGGIVDSLKDKYIITDTLLNGGLTAVKHGNGRDWWIITHGFNNKKYYKILLTPYGIEGPYQQIIGSSIKYDTNVEANFSPDGSKYCISNYRGSVDYMNFDRCTGEFSNAVSIMSPDSFFYGSSFSPNSRFIYASSLYNLYQYDTWDSNLIADVIHIAEWDSFVDPIYHIPVLFFMHQLGPDNKIYLGTFHASLYLNVITNPDSLSAVCDFQPHSFLLPDEEYNYNVPSFPNYDLGALDGSPCDTIVNIPTGLQPPNSSSFRISPNPATTWLNIVYETSADGLFELFDINGKRVAATSLYHYFKNRLIDVSNLPAGVYLAAVTQNGRKVWRGNVIIVKS